MRFTYIFICNKWVVSGTIYIMLFVNSQSSDQLMMSRLFMFLFVNFACV